jgi:predicted flap endonuclease-1-like 5' DNA nuclease
MRLDYVLYVLAVILLIITIVPFIVPINMEITATSVWVVASLVLGLFSIGLGYSQRPKTTAQACQPAMSVNQEAAPETLLTPTGEAPETEENKATMEKTAMKTAPATVTSATSKLQLMQVKGIGKKRATQLKALGINSVDDIAKASAKTVSEKLKISLKTVSKWIENAKELIDQPLEKTEKGINKHVTARLQ